MKDLRVKGRHDLKPDTATFNAVLQAIANGDGAASAEKFLNSMEDNGDPMTAPNTISYLTVITAWAKSKDKNRVERVEKLLERMERENSNVRPNTIVYSSALEVLAKIGEPYAVECSLKILHEIEKRHVDDKSVRPNAYSYSSVMEMIANSPKRGLIAIQAQQLLSRMIKMVDSIEFNNVSYTIVFNNAIKAIEKSSEKNKATKAKNILTLMKTLNESGKLKAPPTVRTYNAIIRCCAFSSRSKDEKKAAFDIALEAFMELRKDKSIQMDSYTYPSIFKACQLLLGTDEKDYEAVKLLFYFCCEDGLLDGLIINNLKNYLPPKVLQSIVGKTNFDSLPKEWSRNSPNRGGKKASRFK